MAGVEESEEKLRNELAAAKQTCKTLANELEEAERKCAR